MNGNEFATRPEVEVICPKCGSTDVSRCHFSGNSAAPECDYNYCEMCEHQWDFS